MSHLKSNTPFGSALSHGSAHRRDHHQWSRRTFLRNLGLTGSVSMLLGKLPLQAFETSAFNLVLGNAETDRVLVLIRLKGGNDGLNTIIPRFDYDYYANLRPGIRIPENQLIDLDENLAMPHTMTALRSLWDEGRMKVISNVGYPEQNLSHFRSTDIWSSASDSNTVDTSGWLGRYLGDTYPDYLTNPPERPPAIQIGGVGSIVFNDTDQNSLSVNVSNPEELFEIAQNGRVYDVENVPPCNYGEQLSYLRSVANSTYIYAGIIKEAYDASSNSVDYGNGSLKEQLALVARLVKGGLGTKLYMVNLDGFDTHADQANQHANLMQEIAEAVQLFYDDLDATGNAKEVLAMTFSEFGRRPQQNASNGTDHGSAAPVLVFGEGLNGSGVVGNKPDLRQLDAVGNLIHTTDFRSIYATVLEDWLCIDGTAVDTTLGGEFDRLALGLSCQSTPVFNAPIIRIEHQARYLGDGQIDIYFVLPESLMVRVEIYNILGQPVARLYDGRLDAGDHRIPFRPQGFVASGHYIYRIEAGGQAFSRTITVAR